MVAPDHRVRGRERAGLNTEDEKAPLSEIIHYINENFGAGLRDADMVECSAGDIERRLVDQEELTQALDPELSRLDEDRCSAFNDYFNEVLEDMFESNGEIYKMIVDDERFADTIVSICGA